MPNFSNLESLSSVRTKINNAITLTEQNALDLDTKQPLDGDLSAIASLALTDVIYYRSAPSTWTPVTIGANLSFVSGVLSATGSSSIAWTDITGKPSFGTASLANTTDFATAAQGALANSSLQAASIGTTVQAYSVVLAGTTASYTIAEQSKLSAIATGATANSSDATLLDRTNHTGTQVIATVVGLQASLDAKAGVGHTHVSTSISDSTSVGRSILTAATIENQRAILQTPSLGLSLGLTYIKPY